MREILFRGKSERNSWVYGSLIKTGDYCCILPDDDGSMYDYPYLDSELGTIDGCAIPVNPETVGQFTGLLDEYGEKIFEGDIMDLHCKYGIRSVVFDEDYSEFEFGRDDPTENHEGLCLCVDHDGGKVIGNIHDNPELLEELK